MPGPLRTELFFAASLDKINYSKKKLIILKSIDNSPKTSIISILFVWLPYLPNISFLIPRNLSFCSAAGVNIIESINPADCYHVPLKSTFWTGLHNMSTEQGQEGYSVIQSDGNSFCGDVVLDSFNKGFRDEDNILDQK